MEAVAPKIPMTLQERDKAPEIIRVSATWEDYLELAEVVPYNIEYFDGDIISMSQATVLHEQLVIQLGALFYFLLENQSDYRVLGSNVKICIEEGKSDFNADLSIIKGAPEYATLPSGRLSTVQIKNPEIVVEILSKSTKAYDQSDKLDQYRLIPSLKHILFVSQEEVFVRIYSRTDQPSQWLDTDYRSLEDTVSVGDIALSLRSIYRKTPLVDSK